MDKKVKHCGYCEYSKCIDNGVYDCTSICEEGYREPYKYFDPWDICYPPDICPYKEVKDNNIIKGVGKDAEIVVNKHGGKQSKVEYRFDLLDPQAMFNITRVLKEGFDKYGSDENWRRISVEEHLNHLLIHLYAYLAGDIQDEHLSHACCRAMFALAVDIANRNNAQSEDIVK